jgi:uncharacterized Zn-binding protein involved in type VI secretion
MLDKAVTVGASGFPTAITVDAHATHPELSKERAALGGAIKFDVDGVPAALMGVPTFKITHTSNMSVGWTSTVADVTSSTTISVVGSLDCTGYARCSFLNSIFATEDTNEFHTFAPLEVDALPCVWPMAFLSGGHSLTS